MLSKYCFALFEREARSLAKSERMQMLTNP
jgi:hypothetical protein